MTTRVSSSPARFHAASLAFGHGSVDIYQGAVAAVVPLLVLERGYTYAAASGIVLASSLTSSIVQPLFGALGDHWRMRWLVPVSIVLAGGGLAAIGVTHSYLLTALLVGVSGIGIAAFHPAGAHRSRELSGGDHVALAWFALGGNIGFAVAPFLVAGTVGDLGLTWSPLLGLPALAGVVIVALGSRGTAPHSAAAVSSAAGKSRRDDWRSFGLMSGAIMVRSIVFVGLSSFIVLFTTQHLRLSHAAGTAALFVLYLGGAFGTLIGGHLARRWSRASILRWSYLLTVPAVAGTLLIPGLAAFVFIALTSMCLYVPFSLHVSLGQDYLPGHMGTASGVTLGLAVSVGGLAAPAIGSIADDFGLEISLLPLIALPLVAYLLLIKIKDPAMESTAGEAPVAEAMSGKA